MLKYSDIFVPGVFPRHTYNPREALQLERKLAESKENLCKLVIVTGQTKSGKTVLAKQVFPTDESIWIDGGSVSIEDDFWQIIIEQLNLFQTKEIAFSRGTNTKFGGKAIAQADFLITKGTGEFGVEVGTNQD